MTVTFRRLPPSHGTFFRPFFYKFFFLLHLNLSYTKRIVLLVPVKLAPPQGLDNLGLELVVAPHREKDLSNPHTSCGSMSFAVGSPHSGLEPGQDHLI